MIMSTLSHAPARFCSWHVPRSCARRRLVTTFALGALLAAVPPAHAEIAERIVAVVGKEVILLSELRERTLPFLQRLGQIPPDQRKAQLQQVERKTLDQMVDDKLLVAEARRLNITVSEHEIDTGMANIMRANNLDKAKLADALRREGKTLAMYREQFMRNQILRFKVTSMMVRPKVAVGEDEIRARYNRNMRALGVEEKVRARHIFIALSANANQAEIRKGRQRAEEVLKLVSAKGADFAALAKQHSEDSVTRAEGGDLGFFARGTLPAAIEEVVFAAKKGEVKGPLRTTRGFHIVKVIDRRESSALPLKSVRKTLRNEIVGEKMEKATAAWLLEVRKKSHVDVRL